MTIADLRALMAKAHEPGPTERYEDLGEDGHATFMTEIGAALYRLPGEAVRALPALLDVAEAALRLANSANAQRAMYDTAFAYELDSALRAALAKLETP